MLTALGLSALIALAQSPTLLRWFVAPDGDDALDGSEPRRTGQGAAGPFRTLRRAFDEVRATNRVPGLGGVALVELVPGTHFLDEPLELTPEDLRRPVHVFPADLRSASLDVGAAGRPRVVVSGGRPITGFQREVRDGRELFVARVPEAAAAKGPGRWRFRELYVDGERRPRARHPDRGYLAVAGLLAEDEPRPWNEGVAGFRFAAGDLDLLRPGPASENARGGETTAGSTAEITAEITVMCRWVESHVRVKDVDFDQGVVRLREPTVFKLDAGDPWYLEGALACLDAPGEWLLDEEKGELLVVPRNGEDLSTAEVIAPRLDRLLVLAGRPDLPRTVEGLTVEDIHFAHSQWWFDEPADPTAPRQSGFPQAAFGVPGAIRMVGARANRFARCSVSHVGGYAIELGPGCQGNLIERCELSDLGGGGIKIGTPAIAATEAERATGNSVTLCRIHDGGRVFHSAVGIWIGQSPRNRIRANEIRDFDYTGISIGWTWGYGASDAGAQGVSFNHVHHIGRRTNGDGPILSDMGAIYTLGPQAGTSIACNWFHDVAAFRYGGWGIYFDEGTSNVRAVDNLVTRTTHGGFHQHYGRENVIAHNVFAFGRDAQIQRSRPEPHVSFTFRDNVVLFDGSEPFAGDWSDGHFVFENNVYWREGGESFTLAGRTFDEWQAQGFDAGSRVADPRFVAPREDRFGVYDDSPALSILRRGVFVSPTTEIPWAFVNEGPRNR